MSQAGFNLRNSQERGNVRQQAHWRCGGERQNKQAKHTGPAAARAGKSVDVQDGKSRFLQKPPAALLCTPFVVVWTTLAVLAYW
eukprot:scaffold135426_cov145-Phaeocystis_antarctica.AAC.1